MSKQKKTINLSLNSEYKSWLTALKQKVLWSRSVLIHQIESGLWQREGKAVSNFNATLPAIQSDLAQQTLKNPYVFDFFTLTKNYNERELEQGLIEHITQFLLELGAGFAYMGKQVHLQVGQRDFYVDLLFYPTPSVIPASSFVIPASSFVIPAKAGIHKEFGDA